MCLLSYIADRYRCDVGSMCFVLVCEVINIKTP